jgi:hypothetical protein
MKVHHYSKALSWITRPRVTETATAETYTPELERMNFKPEKSKADQYKEYLKAEPFLEPESQIYARDQLGFDEGGSAQLVQPGQPGVRQGFAKTKGLRTTYAGKPIKIKLSLQDAVPKERWNQIIEANSNMNAKEIEEAYKNLSKSQKEDLINMSKKTGIYYNRSGLINPTKSKTAEYSGKVKTLKNFNIVNKTKIQNPATGKKFTWDEWKALATERRTYWTKFAKDPLAFRKNIAAYDAKRYYEGKIKRKTVSVVEPLRQERNILLNWIKRAADQGNKNFTVIKEGDKFIGVYDKRNKVTWRPVPNEGVSYTEKGHRSIAKHTDYKKVFNKDPKKLGWVQMAKRFKFESPDTTLGSYFTEYVFPGKRKAPTYSEMYNFLTKPSGGKLTHNPLAMHHAGLVKSSPTKNIQLTFYDKNLKADALLSNYRTPGHPLYKDMAGVDAELKKIGVSQKVGNKYLGVHLRDVTGKTGVATAKRATVKLFKERLAKNPKLVEEMMTAAGYKIKHCLSSGGRVGYQNAGPVEGVNICIRNVINKERELAKSGRKGAKEAAEKFTKFGKYARGAGWLFGWADIPIELGFALPYLLTGDIQGAKRATTAGWFGYGGKKIDEIDREKNPEAYKYFKHKQDIDAWMDAIHQEQIASSKLEELPEGYVEIYKKHGDKSGYVDFQIDQLDKASAKQVDIAKNYKGYLTEEGEQDFKAEDVGRQEAKNYVRQEVKKGWKEGMSLDYLLPHVNLPSKMMGIPSKRFAPFKPDEITNLKDLIEQKGEPYAGRWYKPGVISAGGELGDEELFGDWAKRQFGKDDPRDIYSELPLDYASQLATLEKEEWAKDPRTVQPSAIEQWIWDKKHGFAGGGIANLTRTVGDYDNYLPDIDDID